MKDVWMNLYLLWGTLQDIKEKKISITYLRVGAIGSVLFFIKERMQHQWNVIDIILSLVPGLVFLFIAKASKEKIGFGDGWLFLIIAGWMGTEITWKLWQSSLLLSSFFSFAMLMLKKYKLQNQIPFIPFVWLAHLMIWR